MLPEITPEEFSTGLDAVVFDLLGEAGVEHPPVDAEALARTLGIAVALDDHQPGRARYVRLKGLSGRSARPTILVRPDRRPERRHWAVAHEIGEHVAHRVFCRFSVDPREVEPDAREKVANALASRFLLPGAWFSVDAAALGWDLLGLKSRYSTASHELIARRMLDFGVPIIVTVFDQGRSGFRRSNVLVRVPPASSAEMACWRTAHQENQPHQSTGEAQAIQAWPVHEPGWKREILRTELDDVLVY